MPESDIARLIGAGVTSKIVRKMKALGFRYVTFDLEGYRSGSMNEALARAFLTILQRFIAIIVEVLSIAGRREGTEMHFLRKYRNVILVLGMISIVVGYVFLGYGSISLAPVLLVLGYCILVPLALL